MKTLFQRIRSIFIFLVVIDSGSLSISFSRAVSCARLHKFLISNNKSAFARSFLGAPALFLALLAPLHAVESHPSIRQCSQFGGASACVTPTYGPWIYPLIIYGDEASGEPTITEYHSTVEAYLASEAAHAVARAAYLRSQGATATCSIQWGTITKFHEGGEIILWDVEYRVLQARPRWWMDRNAPCNFTLTGTENVYGVREYICPPGYVRTDRGLVIGGTNYPFLCKQEQTPPPPPPTPEVIPGAPESEDTEAPEPQVPDVAEPVPEPKVSANEGGGAASSGSQDCTGASGAVGDPINTANGSKFAIIPDYAPAGLSPLRLSRFYDSQMPKAGSFGTRWRHSFDRSIEIVSASVVSARRADGKAIRFTLTNGVWSSTGKGEMRLQALGAGQGWQLTTARDEAETYDAQGRLVKTMTRGRSLTLVYGTAGKLFTVTDDHGRALKFEYDGQGRVAFITDPANKVYRYTYDGQGNLYTRTTPDNRTITYLYENPSFPHALTGVQDGNNVRTDTTWYDTKGRAYQNERSSGIDKVAIAYGDDGNATVTDAYSATQSYTFQLVQSVMKVTGLSRNCPTCTTAVRSFERNENGNIKRRTDFNGITTTYNYDLGRNLEISRTEALGTAEERTVATAWHPTLNLPLKITEPGRIIDMDYDANGNMVSLKVTDTTTGEQRTWGYAYGDFSQLTSRTFPNQDALAYAYDSQGLLSSTTTSGGLVTQYRDYDANGHVGSIIYPSGRTVNFTYDEVGRVLTRAESVMHPENGLGWWEKVVAWLRSLFGASPHWPGAQGENGIALTRYTYDDAGLLTDIKLPDGETLHYEYDTAYRLVLARDALGNTVQILRDPMGKPQQTLVTDPSGALALTLRSTYDELGRLWKQPGSNGQLLTQRYDEEGYLLEQVDALGHRTQRGRDARYRTTSITDAASYNTSFEFNALDQLTAVTDARSNTTRYRRNAFGEAISEQSPDRGNLLREFDGGRLKRVTDARGIIQELSYDSNGRLKTRESPNSQVTYTYDEGAYGRGRLTGIDDANGSTRYQYNSRGQVTEKTSTIQQGPTLKVGYGYTLGGKLKEMATPGKHLIQYGYDAQGRLSGLSVDGQPFLTQVRFGAQGITGWTWADGSQRDEVYDQDGRISRITSGNALARIYGYDLDNRLTSLRDLQAGVNDSYGYDALDRLIAQQSASERISYRYDALGNREQKLRTDNDSSLITTTYSYDPASNRLLGETTGENSKSYAYLPSGQLSNDGKATYYYDDDGRLVEVRGRHPLRNTYNALGQRVRKAGQGVTVFAYDEAGHLVGEYTPGGVMVREYVWLGGRLVGMLSQQEKGVLQVHTDHLGTPRAVSNGSTVLWRWDGEAFGNSLPDEQVAGASRKFIMPLRFPGQYYDQENGFFYNYFRDYSPATGRYIESDPIGLRGGINTYAYVASNPVSAVDPLGLWSISAGGYGGLGGGIVCGVDPNTGEPFLSLRAGVGVGGGISFSPTGGRPGGDEIGQHPDAGGVGAGLFGEAGVSVGVGTQLQGNAGAQSNGYGGFDPYAGAGIDGVLERFGINIGAALGVEFTMFGQ